MGSSSSCRHTSRECGDTMFDRQAARTGGAGPVRAEPGSVARLEWTGVASRNCPSESSMCGTAPVKRRHGPRSRFTHPAREKLINQAELRDGESLCRTIRQL